MSTQPDTHSRTRALLVAELDGPRFSHPQYLRWFYDDNPRGAALLENIDDAESGRQVGHYGVLPARFRHRNERIPFIFSTNVATDSEARQSGLFRKMAERIYARASATGAPAMIGVGNEASTVVVVERFGWHRLGPMRAKVAVPAFARGVKRFSIDSQFLASAEFAQLTEHLSDLPVQGWAQHWDTEFLTWRLARPDGGYMLHVSNDAIAVTARTTGPAGIPFAVLLKVWPASPAQAKKPSVPALVGSALIGHRAVACVYAGWNQNVSVPGVRLPSRLQPSPLNVVLKVLDPNQIDPNSFHLDTWELLDMDAY